MTKRRFTRFSVEEMGIHAKASFAAEFELLDISLGGARIRGTKSLKVGGNYTLKLECEGTLLPLDCTVVWEKLSGSVKGEEGESIPLYTAGVEFKDIFTEKFGGLIRFLRDWKILDEQRLKGLRIRILGRRRAVVNYEETYPVRLISFGGMLVETDRKFEVEKRLPMALLLPGEETALEFKGRVASCLRGRKEGCFDIGIEFMEISEEDKKRLEGFLETLYKV